MRGLGNFRKVNPKPIVKWWKERFGVPEEVFRDFEFYMKGKTNVWAVRKFERIPDLRFDAVGMVVVRFVKGGYKPTMNAVQVFGRWATRNVVDLDGEGVRRFVSGQNVEVEAQVEDGYVIVRYRGLPVGCGLYRNGVLKSLVPKDRRIQELM